MADFNSHKLASQLNTLLEKGKSYEEVIGDNYRNDTWEPVIINLAEISKNTAGLMYAPCTLNAQHIVGLR